MATSFCLISSATRCELASPEHELVLAAEQKCEMKLVEALSLLLHTESTKYLPSARHETDFQTSLESLEGFGIFGKNKFRITN